MDPYARLFDALLRADGRFVVIGVGGANYYLLPGQSAFLTEDRDLLLPPDPTNTLTCWQVARASGFELWSLNEPLGAPLDLWLAEKVVEHRAVVTATAAPGVTVDLTYTMSGFSFRDAWESRRYFTIEGVEVPVAGLRQIVESKRRAGRKKDLLFLTTHEGILRELLAEPGRSEE